MFAQYAWEPDFGPEEISTVASPVYTVVDRAKDASPRSITSWTYKERYQDDAAST